MLETALEEAVRPRFGSVTVGTGKRSMVFDYGRTYVVLEKNRDRGLKIASDFLILGSEVLCISRKHPDLLRDNWTGKVPEQIWLSERPGVRNISPAHLSKLVRRMIEFTRGHEHAVVVLDGIEYLAFFNEFSHVQIFVEHLNDVTMETSSVFLMTIDPRSFDLRSLARLKRFAEVVE